jgi:hypothetical protein
MRPTSHCRTPIDRNAPHDASDTRAIVVLATLFNAPIADEAINLAVDAAFEQRALLAVVNVRDIPVGGRGPRIDLGDPPDVAASLRRATSAADAVGVPTTRHRFRRLRPVAALISVINEVDPVLAVVGPDVTRLSALRPMTARRCRRSVRALWRRTSCLLWSPSAEPIPAEARCATTLGALITSWPRQRARLW